MALGGRRGAVGSCLRPTGAAHAEIAGCPPSTSSAARSRSASAKSTPSPSTSAPGCSPACGSAWPRPRPWRRPSGSDRARQQPRPPGLRRAADASRGRQHGDRLIARGRSSMPGGARCSWPPTASYRRRGRGEGPDGAGPTDGAAGSRGAGAWLRSPGRRRPGDRGGRRRRPVPLACGRHAGVDLGWPASYGFAVGRHAGRVGAHRRWPCGESSSSRRAASPLPARGRCPDQLGAARRAPGSTAGTTEPQPSDRSRRPERPSPSRSISSRCAAATSAGLADRGQVYPRPVVPAAVHERAQPAHDAGLCGPGGRSVVGYAG